MIVGAAVCPQPPLLFRELSGADDVVAGLRTACHEAICDLLAAGPEVLVVVGGADRAATWPDVRPADVAGFGGGSTAAVPHAAGARAAEPPPAPPPLSIRVAQRLLDEVGHPDRTRGAGPLGDTGGRTAVDVPVELRTVGWDAPPGELAGLGRDLAARTERLGLLVLGDGSARRGEKAPGHLDARAFDFDAGLVHALGEGDVEALRALDPTLAAELMVLGRSPLRVLAEAFRAAEAVPTARLLHADDPFGVMYLVATWLR